MKINCLIVDDEPLALDLLEKYVRKTPFLQLTGRCNNAFQAMEVMAQEKVDLLFLDIQMPDLSGIAFSRTLQKNLRVIFTTAFEQYALEGFKVDALDYLLKPFNYEEFLKAAHKAKTWFELTLPTDKKPVEEESVFVKSEYKLVKIAFQDILYIEGLKDYVKIYLENNSKPVMSLLSLKAMEEKLPADRFMRVHRSFIVHLDKIQSVDRSRIVFGKVYIPVSDTYKDAFQQYLEKNGME